MFNLFVCVRVLKSKGTKHFFRCYRVIAAFFRFNRTQPVQKFKSHEEKQQQHDDDDDEIIFTYKKTYQ